MRHDHPVPGAEARDSIPALLDPGDQFVPENCTGRLAGVIELEKIRSAEPADPERNKLLRRRPPPRMEGRTSNARPPAGGLTSTTAITILTSSYIILPPLSHPPPT